MNTLRLIPLPFLLVTLSLHSIAKDFSTSDFKVSLPESYRGYAKEISTPVKRSSFVAFDNQFGQSSSLAIDAGKQWNIDSLIESESNRIINQNGSMIEKDCSNHCQAYYATSAQGSSSEHVLLVKTSGLNFMVKFITDDGKEKGKDFVLDLANQIYPLHTQAQSTKK